MIVGYYVLGSSENMWKQLINIALIDPIIILPYMGYGKIMILDAYSGSYLDQLSYTKYAISPLRSPVTQKLWIRLDEMVFCAPSTNT